MADSLLPSGLAGATGPYTWNSYTFQLRVDGEITAMDTENDLRPGSKWDRYALSGVNAGETVRVYMGNSTFDDYLQIARNGAVIAQNDDGGDGERSYDSFVTWTYQPGDVIRATTYTPFGNGGSGTYSIYLSTSSGTVPSVVEIPSLSAPVLLQASDTGLAGDGITSDTTPTVTGTGLAAGTIVALYDTDGATVLGTVVVGSTGAWSITSAPLSNGAHTLTVKTTATNGTVSPASPALTLTVDSTAPAAVTGYGIDVSSDTGTAGDGVTSDTTPTFSGNGEPGATVKLYDSDGTTVLGSAVVDTDGRWTITSATLSDGAHAVTAVQSDAAGNASPASAPISIHVDTQAPTGISLSSSKAYTNGQAGETVGVFATADAGGTGAGFTYALVGGDGNAYFDIAPGTQAGTFALTVRDPADLVSGASYSVRVRVSDGAGNTFEQVVSVQGATLVDGVATVVTPATLPDGSSATKIVAPVVEAGRVEQEGGASVADIPLSQTAGASKIVAQLPVGYGIEAVGGASQSGGAARLTLDAAIRTASVDNALPDQSHLTGGGQKYLAALPDAQSLLVQTVKPLADHGNLSSIVVSGSGAAADGTGVALVIDATGISPASAVTLQDVDFAAIVGSTYVVGRTAGQVLVGDAAAQEFGLSGDAAGSLIFSGGGSDAFHLHDGLAAGSVLHGGTARDTAFFAGSRANYTIEQHDGHVVVASTADPSATIDLVNVETLRFSDGLFSVESRGELSAIAGMYTQILGRQADLSGFEYWGGLQGSGSVSLGQIAMSLLESAEQAGRTFVINGDHGNDVDTLYQALLGRVSDSGGHAYWTAQLDGGALTIDQVADSLVQSAEMTGLYKAPQDWDFAI